MQYSTIQKAFQAGIHWWKRLWKPIIAILLIIAVFVIFMVCVYGVLILGSVILPGLPSPVDIPQYSFMDSKQSLTGEPINIVFIGVDVEGDHLFEQAGWQKLEGFWVEGITKAVSDLGNSTTPISTRYLFGRSQDFAYQGGDSTIDHRHHIRLWKEQSPDGTLVYYATASYDRMIGFAPLKFLFKPTHIIAPNIDDERDLLGGVFASHSPKMTTYYVTNLLPKLFRSNGNNAWFYTDGDVLVFTGENATKRGLTMLQKAKHGYFHFLSYPLKLVNIAQ